MSERSIEPDGAAWAQVPGPARKRLALRVTPAAERALRAGHPWLFDQSIREQSHEGAAGDLAVVFDRKRRFLAIGLLDPSSPIRVRILHHGEPAPIDENWFAARLADPIQRRAPLLADPSTTGYRLVHGENDGLPGLVIDRYGETLVLKIYTAAWLPHLKTVIPALQSVVTAERLVLRLSRMIAERPGLEDGAVLLGPPLAGPVLFKENDLQFAADVVHGQKTGFFLDQRENRARLEPLVAGGQVLNVFAYTGGFSLYAARGGADRVVSLDISEPALEAARHNFKLNTADPRVARADHQLLIGDAFHVLADLAGRGRLFTVVVVDPPSFAKSASEVERALHAYDRLVRLALAVLAPGGTLVMASCSSRIDAELFFQRVHASAAAEGRPLNELARTGHPVDHPIGFPEGAYLKCLFATAP